MFSLRPQSPYRHPHTHSYGRCRYGRNTVKVVSNNRTLQQGSIAAGTRRPAVIVRDNGDTWQVVLQTDHAILSGDFARAWGNAAFETPRPHGTVTTAAMRHDDGWAIWERYPSVLVINGTQKPRNFLDVQIRSHLAFYRAQIAAVLDEDAYAGMLISMHGCGIYNARYGTDPTLKLTFAEADQRAVDEFAAEQELLQTGVRADLGLSDDEVWTNYKLLQIFDRLSLYFCMKDLEAGEAATITSVPVHYGGEDITMNIQADGPWRVRMDPFPFSGTEHSFSLLRREIPKRVWADDDEFRRDFFAITPEATQIVVSA